jgi:hypothetical protein
MTTGIPCLMLPRTLFRLNFVKIVVTKGSVGVTWTRQVVESAVTTFLDNLINSYVGKCSVLRYFVLRCNFQDSKLNDKPQTTLSIAHQQIH